MKFFDIEQNIIVIAFQSWLNFLPFHLIHEWISQLPNYSHKRLYNSGPILIIIGIKQY